MAAPCTPAILLRRECHKLDSRSKTNYEDPTRRPWVNSDRLFGFDSRGPYDSSFLFAVHHLMLLSVRVLASTAVPQI